MQEIQFVSEMLHFGLQNQALIRTLGIKCSILKVNLLSVAVVTLTQSLYRENHTLGVSFLLHKSSLLCLDFGVYLKDGL